MAEMYDNLQHVEDSFTESRLSEYLLQAQWAEFIALKKVIDEVYKRKKAPLKILDIGIGDARILKHLAGIEEMWEAIEKYEAIDVAQNCVDISLTFIKSQKLEQKAHAKLLDAVNISQLAQQYDLIISTWFTVGNFYPFDFDVAHFQAGVYDMSKNDKFTFIFQQAYNMLTEGGEIVMGSMYIDNERTRKHQEDSYRHFGWEVITDERDSFTATKEGWWSQRFTQQKVYDYLPFISKEKFHFIPLDTYYYAMMLRIIK